MTVNPTHATAQADAPSSTVLQTQPLGFPWPTLDPFLFCAHHDDAYPAGNGQLAPAASLAGRQIGNDFSRKDGWSMYHGSTVPGFPPHPHRGFETVTITRKGLIDHADSLGAVARFGQGDVQWLTAGKGIVHAEMFPLLDTAQPNPLELFQIWLNLPATSKMAEPYFTMLWSQDLPRLVQRDSQGRLSEVVVVAGKLARADGAALDALPPPPSSWAAQPGSDVAIWTLKLEPGAQLALPAALHQGAGQGTRRMLYFFKGGALTVAGQAFTRHAAIELRASQAAALVNTGHDTAECLMLQGRPIGEPVAQYGPFVMNTQAEIAQTLDEYRRTQFGGWSFDPDAPVHGHQPQRFARHPDGRREDAPAALNAVEAKPGV